MHDEERMDRLLRQTMAAKVPELPADFEARVLRRLQPRQLTTRGRLALAAYAFAAAATSVWLLRDVRPELLAATIAAGLPVTAAVTAYASRLAFAR